MSGWHAVVVGAGGSIGSHLVPHLARLPRVAALTLIDRGVYTAANVRVQSITPREAGRETLLARSFDIEEDLDLRVASRRVLSRTLASVGLRSGEVFTLTSEHGDRHFEIADSRGSTGGD